MMITITANYGPMNMKMMSATDARTRFGQFIDAAQHGPVVVTNKDRPVGVFFSIDDIQDTSWGKEVLVAHAEGYLTARESTDRIERLLS